MPTLTSTITTTLKTFLTTTDNALQPPERTSEFLHHAAEGVTRYFPALQHVDFAHTSPEAIADNIAAGVQRINTAKISTSETIAVLCTHPRGPIYRYFDTGITDDIVLANAHNEHIDYTRMREYLANHLPFDAMRMCIVDTCCNAVLGAIVTHFNEIFHTNPVNCPWGLNRRALT